MSRSLILPVILSLTALGVVGCGETSDPVTTPPAVARESETLVLGVKGMHCDGCANAIKTKVGKVAGVESCEVSLEGEQATIVGDPAAMADARAAIERLGYDVSVAESSPRESAPPPSGDAVAEGD